MSSISKLQNCFLGLTVKESAKSINIWWRYKQDFGGEFLAHPVRQYHLLKFTNIGSVFKNEHNL